MLEMFNELIKHRIMEFFLTTNLSAKVGAYYGRREHQSLPDWSGGHESVTNSPLWAVKNNGVSGDHVIEGFIPPNASPECLKVVANFVAGI